MFKSVKESTRNELLIDKVMIIKSSLQIREFYNLFLEIVHIYLIVYVHIYLIVYTRTLNAWAIVDEVTKE